MEIALKILELISPAVTAYIAYLANQRDIDGIASTLPGRDGRRRTRWYRRRP